MPYTTRVNGNETEIVGYSYTATGTPEPEVGNDWYPVVIDSYTTAEYESLDAYIASEYGQILLSSCGVSALVPLATAIQRLAENGINITVRQGLYIRTDGGLYGMLVDKEGKVLGNSSAYNQPWRATLSNHTLESIGENDPTVSAMVSEYGRSSINIPPPDYGWTGTYDGITYNGNEGPDGLTILPWPPLW